MNKNLYRLIFNKARGMLMAVPEIARSGRAGSSPSSGTGHTLSQLIGKVKGLSFALLLALGAVQPVQAAIVADGRAPGNQQPTIVGSANGTPQVNIQTPSAGGVSRNVYSQFDVSNKGVVLNNSHASTQTQLAGMVNGNPWLAKGEAKIILNEVNSRNPSQLNGFIEVAGQKAQVVIANPAGITCSGCGFINANRATLTTGQAKLNNGQLTGYEVDRGEIIIQGNGMDSSLQDHTDLIARSVKINAGLWANDLAVTSGRNSVDAAHQNVTRKAADGSARPQVAIDVAALGGMYANKIRLLGTESGVGVHNAGAIGASAGDVVVNADGTLSNSGSITASQAVQLSAKTDLNNSGTLYAGSDSTLRAGAAVSNSGIIAAQHNTSVSAASINSSAKGALAAGMARDGKPGAQGDLTLNSQGKLNANGQNTAAGQLTASASAIDMSGSQTFGKDVSLHATRGDISTAGGNVAATHQLSARTQGLLNNDGGTVSADKLGLSANRLSNQKGTLQQLGQQDLTLSLAGGINNRGGTLASNSNTLTLNATAVDNQQGKLLARGTLTATSSALNNAGGTIQSGQSLHWNTQGNTLNNQQGTLTALGALTLNAGDINNQQGLLAAGESLSVFSAGLDNSNAGNISSKGALAVTSADLNNRAGQIQALGDITLTAASASIDNTGGLIQGAQAVTLSAADIVNSQTRRDGAGIQGSSLSLRAQNLDNRDGALLADNDLSLFLSGTLDNGSGLVSAQGNLQAQAQQVVNRAGDIEAGKNVSMSASGLSGDGNLLSLGDMTLSLTQDFNNSGKVQASHDLSLTTQGDLNNQALIQAGNLLDASATDILNGADAEISAGTTQLTAAQTLTNTGLIDGVNTRILADVVNNTGSGRIYGDWLAIAATTLNNLAENAKAATIAARQRLDLGVSTLNNRDHALIYSDGDMALGGALDANYRATGQASVLNNHSATLESAGYMALNVSELNNINDHFELENVLVSQEHISEYEVARLNNGVRYNDKDYTIYIYQDEVNTLCIEGVICHTTDGDRFTHYDYVRTITEDRIKESDPGKIIAGGSLSITADSVLNDKSQIIAGGDLALQAGKLDNVEVAANRQISDAGTATFYSRHQQKHGDSSNVDVTGYTPPTVIQGIALNASTVQDHARGEGSGLTIGERDAAAAITPATVPAGKTFEVTIGSGDVVRVAGPDTRLPDNSLYQVRPDSTSPYLVETDPRFTNKKQWLSSDYMMNAFTTDPNNVLKRLGDGYYEQRLIREQVIALSGSRYLGNWQSDEEQYKGLMDAGVTFGKKYNLTPGVALTAEQMALLSGDIVWMVAQTVTLADGSSQRVLVPQVYATVKPGDLDGSGALLAGNNVGLNLSGDLNNSGRISGQQRTQLLAQNINNSGGFIQGGDVTLQARTDINNSGGTIAGDHSLLALAGRDINATTTTRSAQSAGGEFARTTVDRVAGLYVQQPDGKLALQAGRDVNLTAAQVVNSGAGGSTAISAGRDLNLGTVDTGSTDNLNWGDNWQHHSSSQQVGSSVTGAGRVTLAAGHDVNVTAGTVNAGQQLGVTAGNDIRVQHGTDGTTLDQHYKATGSSGMLSKTRTESRDTVSQQSVNGSQLGGDSVLMRAGRDLTVTGSSVALSAGNSLTLNAATEQRDESHMLQEKKSGLSGTGGVGVTAGSSSTKTTDVARSLSSVGSTVGSTGGSVTLSAGNSLTVKGSDVLAAKDIALTGKEVNILAAGNQSSQRHVVEQKQSGLTLALSGTVGSALNSAVATANDASKESSGRLAALQGMKAALTGVQAAQAASLADAGGATGSMAGVNLSYGSQSSRSEQTSTQTQSQGSSLTAGNSLTVNATGTDLNVQGSRLQAGKDISLSAARDVNLTSAQNTQRLDGKNESHGGSVGVGINVGQGVNGLSLNASVNKGRGSETGNGTTYSETTVNAGNSLHITSGRDATLTGAQASGEAVKINVGRDLALTSQQDADYYDSKQQNASAGGSVSFSGGSGSVNLSRDKMHSSWRSVEEQTGIFAGKGGFDVTVGEHTQLNGAVIGSTATADKNKLDTGTLGFSDIDNRADYRVEHQSVGVSSGGSIGGQFAGNMANGLLTGVNGRGSDSSTTKSAVSDGTIIVRDQANQKQDVVDLSRDVAHANQTLSPIFDKEKEQNRLKEAQLIGEIGSQAADIARTQGQIAATKAANEKMKNVTPQQLEAAKKAWMAANPGKTPSADDISGQAYTTLYNQAFTDSGFGTGGKVQQAIQAATAAVQGLAGGDLTKAIAGGSAPYIANIIGSSGMDDAGKVLAHAAVNAALAAAQGNNALVGAGGAATAEMIGMIATSTYGKPVSELSEEQKQTVSALATLAAGLAGGLIGDSSADTVAGAQSGKTTVENNYLSNTDITTFTEKYAAAKTDSEKEQLLADLKKLDADKQKQALSTGISIADQKDALADLKALTASPECIAKCQELAAYSISELEPVANNTQLHEDNLKKGILAGVIYALTVEKSASGGSSSGLSSLTKEQQQLIRNAETITTAKGIQNPFPRDLNEKVLWNGVKANPSAGDVLKGMNKDPRFPASAGFQKMQVTHELPDGSNITIHYQYNSNTGKAYDMKIVTPQANPLQPGPSLKDK